jgi:hypothetical protein
MVKGNLDQRQNFCNKLLAALRYMIYQGTFEFSLSTSPDSFEKIYKMYDIKQIVLEFLSIADTQPYIPVCRSVEEKGKYQAKPLLAKLSLKRRGKVKN